MPIQGFGQSVSAPRWKPGVRLNAHTELPAFVRTYLVDEHQLEGHASLRQDVAAQVDIESKTSKQFLVFEFQELRSQALSTRVS
jgi:hypothetical protein